TRAMPSAPRVGTSYSFVVPEVPEASVLTVWDRLESDSRTSTGMAEEVKTGLLAVAQAGAASGAALELQPAARSELVTPTESDCGVSVLALARTGAVLVRAFHSAAVRVQL